MCILAEYFLEDTIEMLKFVPPPRALEKKKKKSFDDNEVHTLSLLYACMQFFCYLGQSEYGL